MISVNHLNKKYGKKIVIHDVSIDFETNIYGLLGPNGAGKTTLLRLIAGVLPIGSGTIQFQDNLNRDIKIGYLPQKFGCFPEFTLQEQMEYFSCLKKIPEQQMQEEIDRVLELVHLEDKKTEKCRKLSGGMIQRAGVAQALLGKQELILLDEPTVGLDPEERNHLNNIIKQLQGKVTVVLSTHLVEDIQYLCNKVLIMKDGEIIRSGEADEIATIADGHVMELPEERLDQLNTKYYIEHYYTKDGKPFVRVLILEHLDKTKVDMNYVSPNVEDGYLYTLKRDAKDEK